MEKWLQPYEKLVEQPIYYKDGPVPHGMIRCTLPQALSRGFAVGSILRAKRILKQRRETEGNLSVGRGEHRDATDAGRTDEHRNIDATR